jgi:hypothetical protein
VDVAITARVPGRLAALPVTAGVALAALVQSGTAEIPPWNWTIVPVVAVGFAVLWGTVDRLAGSAGFARWQSPMGPGATVPGDTPVPAGTGGASAR